MTRDPHQVLGLAAGATAAEVKRAYRRLAKEHHPDSAGEQALPKFLEIQRAYEQLSSASWRPGAKRSAPTEPWRADPARARSTPGARPPGSGSSARGRPGARASGGAPETAGSGAPGTRGGASGAAAGGSRGDASDGAGRRPGAASGTRPRSGTGPRTDGSTGRRRPARKATFGSTTYDEAHDPADPAWSGASWYGPTSGEYWQVNPREYADPRKHGPEYLARAAARAGAAEGRPTSEEDGDPPVHAAPDAPGPAPAAPRRPPAAGSHEPGSGQRVSRASAPRRRSWSPPPAQPVRPQPVATAAEVTQAASATREAGEAQGIVGASAAPAGEIRPSSGAGETGASATGAGGTGPTSAAGETGPSSAAGGIGPGFAAGGIGPGSVAGGDRRTRLTASRGVGRVLGALAAWPPLGIAAAALIGEATGCAAFEASCTPPAQLYPWFAQGAIVVGLFAAPAISRILAGGTAAVAIVAFPVAAALSAGGATYDRARGPVALIAVLAIAWLAGVGATLLRRSGRGVRPVGEPDGTRPSAAPNPPRP